MSDKPHFPVEDDDQDMIPPPPPPPREEPEDTRVHSIHNVPTNIVPPSNARIPVAGAQGRRDFGSWEGRQLGPYRVERELARGGMGVVLLAYEESLRRHVAIKLMEAALEDDNDAARRFEREARAAAAVVHANIAGVYLVGFSDEGMPFLAMEYVDGKSLAQMIKERVPLTFPQVLSCMEQVASGLQAALRVNTIHRDIKPGNIMVTVNGVAKVVDFGLAKIFFEDSYRTQEGMVLGTPSYMAPEQGQGRAVDHRADIYALGATFYHLVTGRPPFTADSPVQIMMKHVTAPLVPMRTLNPAVPIELDEIIARCMHKDVDERYQDYEALLFDIKRVHLMCATREQGAFVGIGGSNPDPGGTSILPPPPSHGGDSWSAAPGSPSRHSSSSKVSFDPDVEEKEGFTVAHWAAFGGLGLIVLAIVGVLLSGLGGGDDAADSGNSDSARRITIVLDRAAEKAGGMNLTPEQEAYLAFKRTLLIFESLENGLIKYEVDEGTLPQGLSDAAKAEYTLMNFQTDLSGIPLDGWGQQVRFDSGERLLRSAGIDAQFNTDDDVYLVLEEGTEGQDYYEKLIDSASN